MSFHYGKLLGLIKEKYGTQEAFAAALGIGYNTLSLKLNNKADFKRGEICTACKLLGIDMKDVHSYFFDVKVEKTQHQAEVATP